MTGGVVNKTHNEIDSFILKRWHIFMFVNPLLCCVVFCGFPADVLSAVWCLTWQLTSPASEPSSLLLLLMLPPSSLDGRADLSDTRQEIKTNTAWIRCIRRGVRAAWLTWILIWTLLSGAVILSKKEKKMESVQDMRHSRVLTAVISLCGFCSTDPEC